MNPNASYPHPAIGAAGLLGAQSMAGMTAPPGIEVGQIQMAIASLNNSIEQACENQQAIEVRLNPILLILPSPAGGEGKDTAQPPVCELGENIKRLQQKVDYLVSRQRHVLQTVQL